MKIEKLLEQHPLATEVIKEWFMEQMIQSFKTNDVPEEFKQSMLERGVPEDELAKYIEVQPRVLFDVFDEHEIYIEIMTTSGQPVKWCGAINKLSFTSFLSFNSRKDIEEASIIAAFNLLEIKMSPILKEVEQIETQENDDTDV